MHKKFINIGILQYTKTLQHIFDAYKNKFCLQNIPAYKKPSQNICIKFEKNLLQASVFQKNIFYSLCARLLLNSSLSQLQRIDIQHFRNGMSKRRK